MQSTELTGLLLIDKPQNFTSNDIVAVARRALGVKRIGHSGTLDPMATGLLIVLVGRGATRLQERFLKLPKVYRAELTLGAETDTWDAQGQILKEMPVPALTAAQIRAAAENLTGEVRQQIPPFSAKKINGRKMYDLAIRAYTNALAEKKTMDEEKKEILYYLGLTYEQMGKKEEAIEQFNLIYEVDIGYRDIAEHVDAYYDEE